MRFLPMIDWGTARYPLKVARRLRAVNIAAWIGVALSVVFALIQTFDSRLDTWKTVAVNAADATLLATVPLLHRWGPLAGGIALFIIAYAGIFALCALFGTGPECTSTILLRRRWRSCSSVLSACCWPQWSPSWASR